MWMTDKSPETSGPHLEAVQCTLKMKRGTMTGSKDNYILEPCYCLRIGYEWRVLPARAWDLFPYDMMWELCLWQRHFCDEGEALPLVLIQSKYDMIDFLTRICGYSIRLEFPNHFAGIADEIRICAFNTRVSLWNELYLTLTIKRRTHPEVRLSQAEVLSLFNCESKAIRHYNLLEIIVFRLRIERTSTVIDFNGMRRKSTFVKGSSSWRNSV
jgi:hypothetical protein